MIDIRQQLLKNRSAQADLDAQMRLMTAQIKRAEQAAAGLKRAGRTPENNDEAQSLDSQIQEMRASLKQLRSRYDATSETVAMATQAYYNLLREQPDELVNMDARIPFLLLPLRLETRFMTGEEGEPQLWVRVYPDDIAIETHETALTERERAAGEDYWRAIWGKASDDPAQIEAWSQLVSDFGTSRAAWIAHTLTPVNAKDDDAPAFPQTEQRGSDWSLPPRVRTLPDRLAFMTFSKGQRTHTQFGSMIPDPLITGLDPLNGGIIPEDGKLNIPPELAWIVNFDEAVKVGMAVKINLTPDEATNGFERVVVLGVRRAGDRAEDVPRLQALFDSHHYTDGLSLIPQGTPTNNTEEASAGKPPSDTGMETSWQIERDAPLFTADAGAGGPIRPDLAVQQDGQRLAEALGLPYATFQHIRHADNTDGIDARAMNAALYPGTVGYYLQEFLTPPIDNPSLRSNLRHFMMDFASGRGPLPSIRVGRQPYGILPTTAYSRLGDLIKMTYDGPPPFADRAVTTVYEVISTLRETWTQLSQQVARVGYGNDPDQTMLDILAQHAAPVEYYMRHAETANVSYDYLVFNGLGETAIAANQKRIARARQILTHKGLSSLLSTQMMSLLWFRGATRLNGPVVDDGPLSEISFLKPATSDKQNYIEWIESSDIATLRNENFGTNENGMRLPVPRALLYLLLNYAKQQAITESMNVILERNQRTGYRKEPEYVHVRSRDEQTVWHKLAETTAFSNNLPIGLFLQLEDTLKLYNLAELRDVRAALRHLAGLSTARLERLLAEHLALCSYRLDAWYTALTYWYLVSNLIPYRIFRDGDDFEQGQSRGRGIYLGAYGYMENLRPARTRPMPVEDVPEEYDDPTPLFEAPPENAGFIHAPSLHHATAAAILRNARLTHAAASNQEMMNVNLSSERVRTAGWYLDGMRAGQQIGALLGYHFERSLHEQGLDVYIQPFRQRFPIASVDETLPNTPVESLTARNVVDGKKLVEEKDEGFPYGITGLNHISAAHQAAIRATVEDTAAELDAVADLVLAEGVYQMSVGNHNRAAAMLDAMNRGGLPPEAEFAQTPRTGTAITHLVGALFPVVVAGGAKWLTTTPRSMTEPRLNAWIDRLLGDPASICCFATVVGQGNISVTAADLEVSAIDFILLAGGVTLDKTVEQPEPAAPGGNNPTAVPPSDLERRLLYIARRRAGITDADPVELDLVTRGENWSPDTKTFLEMLPLVSAINRIVVESRPIHAGDLIAPHDPVPDTQNRQRFDTLELNNRVTAALNRLQATHDALDALLNGGQVTAETLRTQLIAVAAFGLPDFPVNATGTDATAVESLTAQAQTALAMLATRLEAANQALADATAIPVGNSDDYTAALVAIMDAVFGRTLTVMPLFTVHNPDELAASLAAQDDLLESAPPLAVDTWLHGLTRVRPRIAALEEVRLFTGLLNPAEEALRFSPLQVPHLPGERWLALPLAHTPLERESMRSLTLALPGGYQPSKPSCGLLLDDWVEVIPGISETTGITAHFNQPNSEPPQTLLLAIAPHRGAEWVWDDLVEIVLETFDMAKERLVDTDQIDQTDWAQFLPGAVMAVAPKKTTISLNLLQNTTRFIRQGR